MSVLERTQSETESAPAVRPRDRRRLWAYAGTTLAAAIVGLLFALPLWWVLVTSLQPGSQTFANINPLSWRTFWPAEFTLANYANLSTTAIGAGIGNSLLVAALTVVFGLVVCAMAAFALAALDFKGRSLVFAVVILSFLIPFDAIAIPLANLFRDWNLQNTFIGLVLPGLGNGMAIFLLRTFFMAIPGELVEAGRLDGLGWWGIFTRIYLPLARPSLIGAGLMLFLFQWQSYVWPLLIGTDASHVLGPVALGNMQGQFNVDYALMFAGAMVLILIPLAIILSTQRYFIQSVSTTGIK